MLTPRNRSRNLRLVFFRRMNGGRTRHMDNIEQWQHTHEFGRVDNESERRTAVVVWLTAVTMIVEIAAGFLYGSMALLADGWHMGTHVAALAIAIFAYRYARKHAADARFTFGTGKVGVLGAFASAVVLAIVAVLMVMESIHRLVDRPAISFNQALLVAFIGLFVNLFSALILRARHNHGHHGHDHNLRAAYLHVIADAMTSVLAIAALFAGKIYGQVWLDPAMGIVGGLLIARWSWGLLRDTGHILLDSAIEPDLLKAVKATIEGNADNRVADLHIWRVGGGEYAAIVSVVSGDPQPPDHYKKLLDRFHELRHVTVEVHKDRRDIAAE